jgi:hypothetical protein
MRIRLRQVLPRTRRHRELQAEQARLIREGFDLSVERPAVPRDPATGDYCPINRAVYAHRGGRSKF